MLKLSLFFLTVAVSAGCVAFTAIGAAGNDAAWLLFSFATLAFFMSLSSDSLGR